MTDPYYQRNEQFEEYAISLFRPYFDDVRELKKYGNCGSITCEYVRTYRWKLAHGVLRYKGDDKEIWYSCNQQKFHIHFNYATVKFGIGYSKSDNLTEFNFSINENNGNKAVYYKRKNRCANNLSIYGLENFWNWSDDDWLIWYMSR